MVVIEYLAAFYGFVTAYACLHIGGQYVAAWLDRNAWRIKGRRV